MRRSSTLSPRPAASDPPFDALTKLAGSTCNTYTSLFFLHTNDPLLPMVANRFNTTINCQFLMFMRMTHVYNSRFSSLGTCFFFDHVLFSFCLPAYNI